MNEMMMKSKMKRGLSLALLAGAAWLAVAMPVTAFASGEHSQGAFNSDHDSDPVMTEFRQSEMECADRTTFVMRMGYNDGHGNPSRNVQICHVPKNNAPAEHTVIVNQASVASLKATGDYEGLCPNWSAEAEIEALPKCTSLETGTQTDGVWVPKSVNAASLNKYIQQVKNGTLSGMPESGSNSYREIAAQ